MAHDGELGIVDLSWSAFPCGFYREGVLTVGFDIDAGYAAKLEARPNHGRRNHARRTRSVQSEVWQR